MSAARRRSPAARWLLRALALAAASAAATCSQCRLAPTEDAVVDRWLECEECSDGELQAVLALGSHKRWATVSRLATDLLHGPDAPRAAHFEHRLFQAHASDSLYAAVHMVLRPVPSWIAYRQEFADNFEATDRIRAAIAVAKVGGWYARWQLRRAAALPLRADVHGYVVFARDSL